MMYMNMKVIMKLITLKLILKNDENEILIFSPLLFLQNSHKG